MFTHIFGNQFLFTIKIYCSWIRWFVTIGPIKIYRTVVQRMAHVKTKRVFGRNFETVAIYTREWSPTTCQALWIAGSPQSTLVQSVSKQPENVSQRRVRIQKVVERIDGIGVKKHLGQRIVRKSMWTNVDWFSCDKRCGPQEKCLHSMHIFIASF